MDTELEERMDDLGTKMLAIANNCVGPDSGWIQWIEYFVPELCRRAHETGRSWRWENGEITPTAAAECVALAEQIGSWVNKSFAERTFEPFDPFPIPDHVARLIEIDQQPQPTPGPAGVYCIRCEESQLEILPESSPRITFYSCPRCGRHYATEPGQSLHDRWLSPLSLALYDVVQARSPQEHATVTAESLYTGQDRERRKAIMADIADELARPKQKVREILDSAATEEDLREFLSQVLAALERLEGDET